MKYRALVPHADGAARRQGARHRRPDAAPTASTRRPASCRPRCGIRTRTRGRRWPRAAVRACTTRRRCCCPTAACCWPAAAPTATPTNEKSGEIYSPPYLFKGPRPTVTGRARGDPLRPVVHRRHARTRRSIQKVVARPHGLGHAQLRHGPALHEARHDTVGRRPDDQRAARTRTSPRPAGTWCSSRQQRRAVAAARSSRSTRQTTRRRRRADRARRARRAAAAAPT